MMRQIGDVFDSSSPTSFDPEGSNTNAWVTVSVPVKIPSLDNSRRVPQESDRSTKVATAEHADHGALSPAPGIPSTTHGSSEPQLSELKKELFVIFNKWQGTVLQRVRDIRVAADTPSQDYSDDQTNFHGKGRGYRGGRDGGRGNRGRSGVIVRSTGKQDRQHRSSYPRLILRTNTKSFQGPFDRSRSTRQTRSWLRDSARALLRSGSYLS
ncbi:hypothetical protein VUR80DRAFT_7479 [Thermomyces stellatus]